jgi:hypothetical protein
MPSMRPENAWRRKENSSTGPSAFIDSSMNGATSTATSDAGSPQRAKR